MKRNERNNYNHIARDIRKSGIESIINIEVPTNYTHEARQAFHELLTAYNLRAVCIYWNDIEKTWALHYEPARYPEAHDEKRRQESEDVDAVTARMTRRNWTWTGYPAPADQVEAEPAQEAPQEATAAEAEQQPTETENAPQAATQAAEGIEITAITYTTDDDPDPAPGMLIHRPGTTRGIIIGEGVMLPDDPADLLTAYGEREYSRDAAGNYIITA